jgi:filamentous hemagglutinin family protein
MTQTWLPASVTLWFLMTSVATAQIIPDATLPNPSIVLPGCTNCTIEGGTINGTTLFHSFRSFSIPTGGSAFFNQPGSIQTILTRVTGGSASTIDGLIETNPNTNLFLLNPNGITFGENASLQIPNGSFLATTATHFRFADGSEFSATNPQAPPILAIAITPGLQYGTMQGDIVSRSGSLIAEQGLTLLGRNLDLSGWLGSIAGHIRLNAANDIKLSAITVTSDGETGQISIGGESESDPLRPRAILLDNTTLFNSLGLGDEATAQIRMQASESIQFRATQIQNSNFLASFGQLSGKSLWISAPQVSIEQNSSLTTTTQGAGKAGDITINARSLFLKDSQILVETTHSGSGGNVKLNAETITFDNSSIGFGTGGAGAGGNLTVQAQALTLLNNSGFFGDVNPTADGTGGGSGGLAQITVAGTFWMDGAGPNRAISGESTRITMGILQGGQGRGGQVQIQAGTLILQNGAILKNSAQGAGHGGLIQVSADRIDISGSVPGVGLSSGLFVSTDSAFNAGDILISAGNVRIADGAAVSAQSRSTGKGGNITITARDSLTVIDGGQVIATSTQGAPAGNITVTTDRLVMTGSDLNYATRSALYPSLIASGAVNAQEATFVANNIQSGPASGFYASILGGNSGKRNSGGRLAIAANQFSLSNGARLEAATKGYGNAGDIDIQVMGSLDIAGSLTRIDNSVSREAVGDGGITKIQAGNLSIRDGAQFFASTAGQGKAGDIQINVLGAFELSDRQTSLVAETRSDTGRGGVIEIQADQFRLANRSTLNARTTSASAGGGILIRSGSFELSGGAQLTTTASGSGQAGNIVVSARDRITLSGQGTGLFANTTETATGGGGSIFLVPTRLAIEDQSIIAVDSRGTGQGGSIEIVTDQLTLSNRAVLSAETASANGGNITIQSQDTLLLRQGSLISASAGTAQSSGNGGNIAIVAPFIVGVLSENSDIQANAFTGNGGTVEITAQGIFGLRSQSMNTPESDITASSNFGTSGEIILNTLNTDPSRGMVVLPVTLVDPSHQISQSCASSGKASSNQFTVTGRSGLPTSPTDLFTGNTALIDLTPVRILPQATAPQPIQPTASPSEIIEAQDWVEDEKGGVTLVAHMPQSALYLPSALTCPFTP